ncbi:MAG: hypothetical protein P4L59_09500 [Desulfosporosinus sp.]|nr:hypothetical protein [Desulfosporosinus sp.]
MKAVKEKALEQAFLRVMNRLICSKDAFIPQGFEKDELGYSIKELPTQARYVLELRELLMVQENRITKFDERIFRMVIDRVKVRSLVEVEFVFKAGDEIMEILKP